MTVDPSRVADAHALLAQMGVSVADLQAAPAAGRRMPTVAEYLPRVRAAATPSSCRTYGSYWTRMAAAWSDWPLDAVAATDVEALQRACVKHARRRSNGRGGRHAGENVISAARAFFTRRRRRPHPRWRQPRPSGPQTPPASEPAPGLDAKGARGDQHGGPDVRAVCIADPSLRAGPELWGRDG